MELEDEVKSLRSFCEAPREVTERKYIQAYVNSLQRTSIMIFCFCLSDERENLTNLVDIHKDFKKKPRLCSPFQVPT